MVRLADGHFSQQKHCLQILNLEYCDELVRTIFAFLLGADAAPHYASLLPLLALCVDNFLLLALTLQWKLRESFLLQFIISTSS